MSACKDVNFDIVMNTKKIFCYPVFYFLSIFVSFKFPDIGTIK